MNARRILSLCIICSLIFIPRDILAADLNEISRTVKYYKTVTNYENTSTYSEGASSNSYSEEISEEEFNAFDPNADNTNSTSVETTYKKMTTVISKNGSKFHYRVDLYWKNFPKVRSYDIIGIGHYTTVKLSGDLYFEQQYCLSSGTCACTASYVKKTTSSGSTVTFPLPTGSITGLVSYLEFDVVKSGSSTVTSQLATGDYAHATSTVTKTNAQKHTISNIGIDLDSSIVNSYDEISEAQSSWSGSW